MLLVKVTGNGGSAPMVFRLNALPATLGRSIKNTVWIDDPSVSAVHAELESDPAGGYWLSDLGSRHGIRCGEQRARRFRILGDTTFHLAGVQVDVLLDEPGGHTGDFPLEGSSAEARRRPWRQAALGAGAVISGAFIVTGFHETKPFSITYGLILGAITLGLAAGLAFALALFSKLHGRRYQYLRLFLFSALTTAFLLLDFAFSSTFYFNLELATYSWVAGVVSYIEFIALFFLFFSSLGKVILPEIPPRTRRVWVAGLGTVIAGILFLVSLSGTNYRTALGYPLRPITPQGRSPEALFKGLHDNVTTITKQAEREARKRKQLD